VKPVNVLFPICLLAVILSSCGEPLPTGVDSKSECQVFFQTWEDMSASWEESRVFRDSDFDGFGECVYSKRWSKKSNNDENQEYFDDENQEYYDDGNQEYFDDENQEYYDDGNQEYYDDGNQENYDECIGDCNDMDNDGRTWDDYDGDGDGLYESP
jgi:hypothetical protein